MQSHSIRWNIFFGSFRPCAPPTASGWIAAPPWRLVVTKRPPPGKTGDMQTGRSKEGKMEFQALYVLVTSMILNFIVLGISLNRPDSFYPVTLSAIAISLQGYALRLIAINSIG